MLRRNFAIESTIRPSVIGEQFIDNLLKKIYITAEVSAASVDSGAYQKFIAKKTIKQKDVKEDDFSGRSRQDMC